MSFNWSLFIHAIREEGVPNFDSDGKQVWNSLDNTLSGIFQHHYTTLSHTKKVELKKQIFQLCFKALSASDDWQS